MNNVEGLRVDAVQTDRTLDSSLFIMSPASRSLGPVQLLFCVAGTTLVGSTFDRCRLGESTLGYNVCLPGVMDSQVTIYA